MGTRLDALDLAIANVQSSIPDVSAFVTSLQVRALIDTSLSDYYDKQAIDGKLADYYTKTEIGNNFFTKQQTNNLLNTTLQNYYNKTETNAQIDSKLTDYYTKSQVYSKTETDTKLTDYYTKTETYSKTEVDNLIPESVDLSLYAKKNDANQTIRTGIVSCVTYQNPNGKSVIYIADASAYTTRPFLATDATHGGTMTYAYMSGNRSGYAYFGLWRDDYYPHLTLTKTLTTFNKPSTFNGVVTFNNDVTFNDVVVLTNTIALGTKVIDTVVRSNDDITPSDMNIPSTLWTQNKFNTKVDNGTVYTKIEINDLVYTKVDLNDLLQLTNLNTIQLLADVSLPQYISPLTPQQRIFFSSINDYSQKLYISTSSASYSTTYNFSGYGLYIRNNILFFAQNQIKLEMDDLYTIDLPSATYKAIKITNSPTSNDFSFYNQPFVLGNPIQLPNITNFIPQPNLNDITIQLDIYYAGDQISSNLYGTPENHAGAYIYTYIPYMSGETILNGNYESGGMFFICHEKYVENNKIYTTLRCVYLEDNETYSFTSNRGSVFFVRLGALNYSDFGHKFNLTITGNSSTKWYNHYFTTGPVSASSYSSYKKFVFGDFALPCGMFNNLLTCLS